MQTFQQWRDAVYIAPDEKALLAVVHDYVRAIDPRLLELMPSECQQALDPKQDLQIAAVMLLQWELVFGGQEEMAKLLHEVAQTFAAASIRLGRLRTDPLLPLPK